MKKIIEQNEKVIIDVKVIAIKDNKYIFMSKIPEAILMFLKDYKNIESFFDNRTGIYTVYKLRPKYKKIFNEHYKNLYPNIVNVSFLLEFDSKQYIIPEKNFDKTLVYRAMIKVINPPSSNIGIPLLVILDKIGHNLVHITKNKFSTILDDFKIEGNKLILNHDKYVSRYVKEFANVIHYDYILSKALSEYEVNIYKNVVETFLRKTIKYLCYAFDYSDKYIK